MRFTVNRSSLALAALFVLLFVAMAVAQKTTPITSNAKKIEKALVQAAKFYLSSDKYTLAARQLKTALSLNPDSSKIKRYVKDVDGKLGGQTADTESNDVIMSLPRDMAYVSSLYAMSLNDCVTIAIKNNIPLQISTKNVKLAEMRLWEARRNMLPTATVNYQQYSGRVSGREYVGRKQYIEGQQPVFRGGELYFTMKQAELNLEIVKTDYAKTKGELVLQVKKAYYSLLKSKENTRLQRELSLEVAKICDMVHKEYDSGIASKIELLNVDSQAGQVKYQLLSAEGDESVGELILKQAMSASPSDRVDIQPAAGFKKAEIDFDKVLKLAYMNRPEMKINLLSIAYYKYERDITRAKGWPKVDLMGNWGLAKEEYASEDRLGPNASGVFDPDAKLEQQWYAGFKVSMPFWGSTAEYAWTKEHFVPVVAAFQGTEAVTNAFKVGIMDNFKYYSDKQSGEIDFARAKQEMMKIEQDIALEARESCFNYEKALLQIQTAESKVNYQQKDLEFSRLKREMDEAPDSNVIEGLIKLAQEKFGYVQALTDCLTAIASINKAIGIENYMEDYIEKGHFPVIASDRRARSNL